MTGWRMRVCAGEGYRAWRGGRWMTALLALAWITPVICGFVDARAVHAIAVAEARWYAAGGGVLVATNKDAGVSASRCDSLVSSVSGVEASIGLAPQSGAYTPAASPDALLKVVAVTPGATSYLGVPPGDGALITGKARDVIGSGAWTALSARTNQRGDKPAEQTSGTPLTAHIAQAQPLKISAVVNSRHLSDEYETAVLIPTAVAPTATADSCYVRAVPGRVEAVRNALSAALVSSDPEGQTVIAPFLVASEFDHDWAQDFTERPTRRLPIAAGIALGLLWIIVRWLRRSEDGLYETLGAHQAERAVIRGAEWLLSAAFGTLVGILLAAVAVTLAQIPPSTALAFMARSIGLSLVTSALLVMVTLLIPIRDPLSALKDR